MRPRAVRTSDPWGIRPGTGQLERGYFSQQVKWLMGLLWGCLTWYFGDVFLAEIATDPILTQFQADPYNPDEDSCKPSYFGIYIYKWCRWTGPIIVENGLVVVSRCRWLSWWRVSLTFAFYSSTEYSEPLSKLWEWWWLYPGGCGSWRGQCIRMMPIEGEFMLVMVGVAAFGTLIQDIQVSGHCLEDVYVCLISTGMQEKRCHKKG